MSTQRIHEAVAPENELETAHEDRLQHEAHHGTAARSPLSQVGNSYSGNSKSLHSPARVVSAGQWMREVAGIKAPFGHDGLPTVWG